MGNADIFMQSGAENSKRIVARSLAAQLTQGAAQVRAALGVYGLDPEPAAAHGHGGAALALSRGGRRDGRRPCGTAVRPLRGWVNGGSGRAAL